MVQPKSSFLKQWFTFTYKKNGVTNLLYYCKNNHYIHSWLEHRGYTEFENTVSKSDLDDFITSLNDSINMIPDCFDINFPASYIEGYNLEGKTFVKSYREHCQGEMSVLFDILWDIQAMLEDGAEGIFRYHIYQVD
jgi:hypothetical protein